MQNPTMCCTLNIKREVDSKWMEKDKCPANEEHKRAGVATSTPGKVDFKIKSNYQR